ncbi:MAG: twin-arginine translocase TatA/TatE family subunit [Chloroflexi bacterium]|nr:twin-arginine translocase TatA/TatE family subunit [Chloroflexota bacterium]
MYGLQPTHLVIILIIALLVFGPSRVTDLGRALGKTVGEFRAASKEPDEKIQQGIGSGASQKQEPPKPA